MIFCIAILRNLYKSSSQHFINIHLLLQPLYSMFFFLSKAIEMKHNSRFIFWMCLRICYNDKSVYIQFMDLCFKEKCLNKCDPLELANCFWYSFLRSLNIGSSSCCAQQESPWTSEAKKLLRRSFSV